VPRAQEILIVMPDAEARDLTIRLFERGGYLATHVATGREALELTTTTAPVLVLLDLDLTDMTGYEACFELRDRLGAEPMIIVVSGKYTEPADRVAALTIGADDFLTKPFDPDELLARTRRLLARASGPTAPALDARLTGREIQVLRSLADGRNERGIADDLFISPKTVATHVQRIITKLGVHSRTEAVAIAYKQRLVGRAEDRIIDHPSSS
jgi:DNA-binding NarL/FixJ family response regulator